MFKNANKYNLFFGIKQNKQIENILMRVNKLKFHFLRDVKASIKLSMVMVLNFVQLKRKT